MSVPCLPASLSFDSNYVHEVALPRRDGSRGLHCNTVLMGVPSRRRPPSTRELVTRNIAVDYNWASLGEFCKYDWYIFIFCTVLAVVRWQGVTSD